MLKKFLISQLLERFEHHQPGDDRQTAKANRGQPNRACLAKQRVNFHGIGQISFLAIIIPARQPNQLSNLAVIDRPSKVHIGKGGDEQSQCKPDPTALPPVTYKSYNNPGQEEYKDGALQNAQGTAG